MNKRNKYIFLYALLYALVTTIILTIFWIKNTPWFLIGFITNIISFLILIQLEKNHKDIRKDQILTNQIIRSIVNFLGVFTVYILNRTQEEALIYAFMATALGFLSIKIGIYTYKLVHREKEV